MAENPKTNTGILAKAQKRISRTKTKVLQNLGKQEKTKDETFNTNVTQIDELQERTQPLHKELSHYLHCVKNLSQASQGLHSAIQTVYEDDWPDKQLLLEQMKMFDLLWNDFLQNFQDTVMAPTTKFLNHFPEFKTKVAKRGRKLVDYDNSKHHLDNLQAAKKRDDLKIEKAQEELKDAKRIYEEINQELLAEMPAFYNSRCHFFGTLLTSLFGAEFTLHSEIGKINATFGDVTQKLASQSEPMSLRMNTAGSVSSSDPPTPVATLTSPASLTSPSTVLPVQDPFYTNQASLEEKQKAKQEQITLAAQANGKAADSEDEDDGDSDEKADMSAPPDNSLTAQTEVVEEEAGVSDDGNYVNADMDSNMSSKVSGKKDGEDSHYEEPSSESKSHSHSIKVNGRSADGVAGEDQNDKEEDGDKDEDCEEMSLYSHVPSNRPVNTPPPGTLYQVQATHRYKGEDVDELNFEAGEVIYVVSFDNPDEQDDGWLMGIKQSDGVKGVFPENFTKKI